MQLDKRGLIKLSQIYEDQDVTYTFAADCSIDDFYNHLYHFTLSVGYSPELVLKMFYEEGFNHEPAGAHNE